MELYQVKSGDSLSVIARDVLGDTARWPEIARLNNISGPAFTIFPGMQLIMPDDAPAPVVPAGEVGPPTPPLAAGFNLRDIEPQTWMYLGLGAVVLFLMMDTKK